MPRFHIAWGTGSGIVEPFVRELRKFIKNELVTFLPRHKVDELVEKESMITGVNGTVLEPTKARRGEKSNRTVLGESSYEAEAVFVASGGIGVNFDLVRKNWPSRLGKAPNKMISGVSMVFVFYQDLHLYGLMLKEIVLKHRIFQDLIH